MPRVVLAPDKFKGCLPAEEVARAIARGLPEHWQVTACPMSDGGDGFVRAMGGQRRRCRVVGPLPDQQVEAEWGMLPDGSAVIEMAAASGLALVPPELRNPMHTTTFGTGQLLLEAARAGARRILLGIGGSATIDAGLGLCQAAGHTILRRDGQPTDPRDPLCGRDLDQIHSIKRGRGSPLDRIAIEVACDVTSPLTGPAGAARVFGPQKGATPDQVEWFDAQLQRLAAGSLKLPEAAEPGAGAAGGLGWALLSFFNARLTPGFDLVANATDLPGKLAGADCCITAEGCYDASSAAGKVCGRVARLCRELGVPCILLAGRIEAPVTGFAAWQQVTPEGMPLPEALARAPDLLAHAARAALARLAPE